jgi:hypothetical protein
MFSGKFVLPAHIDRFPLSGFDRRARVLPVVPPNSRWWKIVVNLLFDLTHCKFVVRLIVFRSYRIDNGGARNGVDPFL